MSEISSTFRQGMNTTGSEMEQKGTSIAINRANEKRKKKRTKFEWVSKLYIVQHATFSVVSKIMTFPYTYTKSLSLSITSNNLVS